MEHVVCFKGSFVDIDTALFGQDKCSSRFEDGIEPFEDRIVGERDFVQ